MIKKVLKKIFKKISYILFINIYGKIEESIKGSEDQNTNIQLVNLKNDLTYNVYKVTNGRLYTDRIHDTALISGQKIIEGASFQIRNNNNSPIINNIVFSRGTQRKLRKLKGTTLSLLTGGGGNSNYWHWIYDVLPRLKICDEAKSIKDIDYFILPSLEKNFQKETLQALGISKNKLLSSVKYRHILSNELIVTDHPYMLTKNAHNDVQNIPKWIVDWLKSNFLKNINTSNTRYPKKIYIDRSDSQSNDSHMRTIINEKEVKEFLTNEGFVSLRLADFKFEEQVQYFNQANYIIGLHGAGFANLSFCKPKTKVLEFRNKATGKMYENLAKLNNLTFESIILETTSDGYMQLGHIEVPINILKKKIANV